MNQLRTIAFFLGWIVATLLIGFLGLPSLLNLRTARFVAGNWGRLTVWWLGVTCGLRGRIEGTPQSRLIACKHQSTFETMLLFPALGAPAFVLKRELYWIPVFGWYLRATGQIAIDRSDGRSAMEQIKSQAQQVLAEGRSIVIFPEGTRVRIGHHKPYRTGIARISALLNEPVTPAAVNTGLFWPKHKLAKKPGTATLKFLPPIAPCTGDQTEWMTKLEATIEGESAKLVSDAS